MNASLMACICAPSARGNERPVSVDSDRDGLSDALEQRLLVQFAPRFMIGKEDCAGIPAEFKADLVLPTVAAENGTIYGQVTLAQPVSNDKSSVGPEVEIHFYHLWSKDCGPHGHRLDTEHVSVLVHGSDADLEAAKWRALYWYAGAHENTVCDVSQIARASTLNAEDQGAKVWISPGKHASYLSETICRGGCGADRCEGAVPLEVGDLINLGEPGRPTNGAVFVASTEWPLLAKMSASNFPAAALLRVDGLPALDVAWANPGRHPAQGVISNSASVEGAIAESGHNTAGAVSVALTSTGDATGDALSKSAGSTGNALQKSYRKTRRALGKSAKGVGEAMGGKPKDEERE